MSASDRPLSPPRSRERAQADLRAARAIESALRVAILALERQASVLRVELSYAVEQRQRAERAVRG